MSASDDYPCLDEGSSIHDWDEQYGAMCDEIDRLRADSRDAGVATESPAQFISRFADAQFDRDRGGSGIESIEHTVTPDKHQVVVTLNLFSR